MRPAVTRRQLAVALLCAAASRGLAAAPPPEEDAARPDRDGPTHVAAQVFLVDVSKIDGAAQSLSADVFVVLRWRDPRLADPAAGSRRMRLDAVWNPRLQIANEQRAWKTLPEVVEVAPDGAVTYRQRFIGQYAAPLDLHAFPLDRHTLRIEFASPGYSPQEVAFGPAAGGGAGRSPNLSVPDWSIGPVRFGAEPYRIAEAGMSLAGFQASFDAKRLLGFYVGKAFASVAIILCMAWVVFWLSPAQTGPRVSVSVTSMLTLIAYRFLLGSVLPPVPYLTRLDYFLLGCTALVFATLVAVVVASRRMEQGREADARRLDRVARWAFPVAFAAVAAFAFFWGP
jgi:hypothetical protein